MFHCLFEHHFFHITWFDTCLVSIQIKIDFLPNVIIWSYCRFLKINLKGEYSPNIWVTLNSNFETRLIDQFRFSINRCLWYEVDMIDSGEELLQFLITGSKVFSILFILVLSVLTTWTISFFMPPFQANANPSPFAVLILVILFCFQVFIKSERKHMHLAKCASSTVFCLVSRYGWKF